MLTRIWTEHFPGRVRLAAQTLGAIAASLPSASSTERVALLERASVAPGRR